ncbi:MAG: thiol reductant ABC exporter subunit CydC [Flaviflexus sp.]|uniref:thiol reductant ABC exporter subunit CydC n=1 Tax=Flaviflexus sp. TaxID=1969482 RepID=UPI00352F791D
MRPTTIELLRWLSSITRPVHGPLFLSTLLRIIKQVCDLLLFGLAGWTVMEVAGGRSLGPLFALLILIALVKAAAYYGEQFTGHYVAFKALELLRGHAFASLWPKAPGIVARSRSGDLLSSLTKDVDRIEVVYAHTVAPVISAIIVPPLTIITIGLVFGWQVVLIPAVCVAVSLLIVPLIGFRSSGERADQVLSLRGDMSAHVTDSVFGVEDVVGYGREQDRLREMGDTGERIASASVKSARATSVRRGINTFLNIAIVTSIIAVGIDQGMVMSVVCALAVGSLRLLEGPRGIEEAAGSLDRSLAAAHRLWQVCHIPEMVSDGPTVKELSDSPTITFDNVSYAYPEGEVPVLKNISLDIEPGRRTVFVGPSGSGKSTTAQLLLRFDDPDEGQILIDGLPLTELTLDSLRSQVVLVSQRSQLLDSTIEENLRLGKVDATEDEIWDALRIAHIDDEVKSMPAGLRTRVGQDGSKLSGGQGQRICLARALLTKPKVLILDEFTANLNSDLEKAIREEILESLGGLTIIEITHRLDDIDGSKVVTFENGTITNTVPGS